MPDSDARTVFEELRPIFADVLQNADLVLTRESSSWNTPDWDSLAHIDLIVMVERQYKMRFTATEVRDLKNVGDIVDLIVRRKTALTH